ncbi:MAG TPA: hypothetical protein V6C81_23915 [Planktothrix sp.]|jgi:hypothetical protein
MPIGIVILMWCVAGFFVIPLAVACVVANKDRTTSITRISNSTADQNSELTPTDRLFTDIARHDLPETAREDHPTIEWLIAINRRFLRIRLWLALVVDRILFLAFHRQQDKYSFELRKAIINLSERYESALQRHAEYRQQLSEIRQEEGEIQKQIAGLRQQIRLEKRKHSSDNRSRLKQLKEESWVHKSKLSKSRLRIEALQELILETERECQNVQVNRATILASSKGRKKLDRALASTVLSAATTVSVYEKMEQMVEDRERRATLGLQRRVKVVKVTTQEFEEHCTKAEKAISELESKIPSGEAIALKRFEQQLQTKEKKAAEALSEIAVTLSKMLSSEYIDGLSLEELSRKSIDVDDAMYQMQAVLDSMNKTVAGLKICLRDALTEAIVFSRRAKEFDVETITIGDEHNSAALQHLKGAQTARGRCEKLASVFAEAGDILEHQLETAKECHSKVANAVASLKGLSQRIDARLAELSDKSKEPDEKSSGV